MKLIELRVRNFRSIEAEQRLPIPGAMTLVGPNNSGKTNLLLAIQLLVTVQANNFGYSRDEHLTFEVGKNRTSITATFEGDLELDKEIFEDVDDLHRLQGSERSGNQISLNLYFTETNTPVYSFFPNHKRPQRNNDRVQYSRTHISLLNKVLTKFKLHYVPSAKSIGQIYQELINPFLRKKVSAVIGNQIPLIEGELNEAAGFLNKELVKAGLDGFHACFRLPGKSVEALVSGLISISLTHMRLRFMKKEWESKQRLYWLPLSGSLNRNVNLDMRLYGCWRSQNHICILI